MHYASRACSLLLACPCRFALGAQVLHLNVPKAYHDKYNEYDEDRENEDDESDEDEDCEDEECDDEDGEHEGIYHYSHINAQYAVLPPGVEVRHGCK